MMEEREKEEETTSSNNNEGVLEEREIEENNDEEEAWGTLEELLLACAVNRHGTDSWDSIANELKKRIKHSSYLSNNNDGGNEDDDVKQDEGIIRGCGFSSQKCRKKYVQLKRRFPEPDEEQQQQREDDGDDYLQRMVDELRKLRVEELKREVHRRDVSIVSLELKVKKLEEERESKSKVKEEEEVLTTSDLRNKPEKNATKTGEKSGEPDKAVTAAESAENRSCNESNSTNHHHDNNNNNNNIKIDSNNDNDNNNKNVIIFTKREPEDSGLVGPESKNRNAKKKGEPVVVTATERKVSRLASESTQQSSEVQSCASLSKKKRRRFRGGGGDSGDELEAEEVSPANKRSNVKSQPLVRFLDILRSHKHGSVFQRRLPSQDTEKYRNVIRQHMDLDTVQLKLDKGIYCDCHPKFYRDLLLIFTNAVLFYRKSSAEHIAAKELRKFVIDEVNQKTRKPKVVQPRKPDPEPQHLEPVVKKPRSSTTMVVCRRPSSSSMQALSDSMKKVDTTSNMGKNGSGTKLENGRDDKIKPNHHQKKVADSNGNNNRSGSPSSKKEKVGEKGRGGGDGDGDGDGNLKKLLTRQRSNMGNGGLRLSSNNGKKIISKDNSKKEKLENNVSKDNKDESSEGEGAGVLGKRKNSNADQKQEKGTPIVLKKQGVADFLKRMKQNSPSSQEKAKNNGSDEEENQNEDKGGRREKIQSAANNYVRKAGGNLKKSIKEAEVEAGTTRRSSSRRVESEAAAASRRGIGRPPKRKAAMMSGSTPDSAKGGRSVIKDSGEKSKKKPRR